MVEIEKEDDLTKESVRGNEGRRCGGQRKQKEREGGRLKKNNIIKREVPTIN